MFINRVFVYGSLKQNNPLEHVLVDGGAKFACTTRVKGYLLHRGAFPALILEPSGHAVEGEIWDDVTKELLGDLDVLEGIPTHYQRVAIECNNHMTAWVYVMSPEEFDRPDALIIPGSCWWGPPTASMLVSQWLKNVEGIQYPHQYKKPSKPKMKYNEFFKESVVQQYGEVGTALSIWEQPPPPPPSPYGDDGCIPGVKLVWAGGTEPVPPTVVKEQAEKGF